MPPWADLARPSAVPPAISGMTMKGRPSSLAEVVDLDDVGMLAQLGHGLRLALDAAAIGLVQAADVDEGEGDFTVEQRVEDEINCLGGRPRPAAPFTV